MALVLILSILICGYIVGQFGARSRYKLHQYHGQHLYLVSATRGLFCLATALIVWVVAAHVWDLSVETLLRVFPSPKRLVAGQDDYFAMFIIILSVVMMAVAMLGVALSHLLFCVTRYMPHCKKLQKEQPRYAFPSLREFNEKSAVRDLLQGNPLSKFFGDCLPDASDEHQLIMITLENRKVYIGYLQSIGNPTDTSSGVDESLAIYVHVGGYRDHDTLEVKLCDDYSSSDKNYIVYLKQSLVQSANKINKTKLDPSLVELRNTKPNDAVRERGN